MVWTGREVVVWGGGGSDQRALADGAAYDPAADRWRALPTSPLAGGPPNTGYSEPGYSGVWTGDEVLIWGGAASEGAAYDPGGNRWRRLAPAPMALDFSDAFWTGEEMLVVGGTITNNEDFRNVVSDVIVVAYDPVEDSWRQAPESGFGGQVTDAAWDGNRLVVLSYKPPWTTSHDPSGDRWIEGPRWNVSGSGECAVYASAVHRGAVVGQVCGIWGLVDGDTLEQVLPPFDELSDRPGFHYPQAAAWTGAEALVYDPGYPPGPNSPTGSPGTFLAFTP